MKCFSWTKTISTMRKEISDKYFAEDSLKIFARAPRYAFLHLCLLPYVLVRSWECHLFRMSRQLNPVDLEVERQNQLPAEYKHIWSAPPLNRKQSTHWISHCHFSSWGARCYFVILHLGIRCRETIKCWWRRQHRIFDEAGCSDLSQKKSERMGFSLHGPEKGGSSVTRIAHSMRMTVRSGERITGQ